MHCPVSMGWNKMDKIMLSRVNKNGDTVSCTMTHLEQQEHFRHIIGRANQSVTAPDGFADNPGFFKVVVQEAHTFTDKHGVVWFVGLTEGG